MSVTVRDNNKVSLVEGEENLKGIHPVSVQPLRCIRLVELHNQLLVAFPHIVSILGGQSMHKKSQARPSVYLFKDGRHVLPELILHHLFDALHGIICQLHGMSITVHLDGSQYVCFRKLLDLVGNFKFRTTLDTLERYWHIIGTG